MRLLNHVGPENSDVVYADRVPPEMFGETVGQAEHRQIAASGLDEGLPPNDPDGGHLPGNLIGQGARDVADHNIPSAFDCALWPIRVGAVLWRALFRRTWRELVRQLGEKLYGKRPGQKEVSR